MTEELENKATSVLLSLIDKLEEGGEVLAGELPELLEQLLMWKMAVACISNLALVVLYAGLIWFVSWLRRQGNREGSQNKPEFDIAAFFVWIVAIIVAVFMIEQISVVLQIWIAPKVYLLEYAAGLVSK